MGGGFHSHNTTCSPIGTFDTADPPPLRIGAFSPLLIRTGRAQRERERGLDREADPRAAHVSQGWEPVGYGLEILCFVVSKSNQEAGGLASLVQCSWIPAVTVAGTILGVALFAKTHPPCIPGQSLELRVWSERTTGRKRVWGTVARTELSASS